MRRPLRGPTALPRRSASSGSTGVRSGVGTPGTSVAVERRTVSLWAVDESPVRRDPRRSAKDPAGDALAAITSSYRHGRDGIIAGDSPPPARPLDQASPADASPPTFFPTVPVAFLPKPAEVPGALAVDGGREVPTFWSRLVRTRRGRHAPKS
jgi:hypothetical protein